MKTEEFPGPMTMVRIDGVRIRKLREGQGLTQLYLATSVGVTTDTISRWENKRYPNIKKENAIKLAEALKVQLSEILDNGQEEVSSSAAQPNQDEIAPHSTPVIGTKQHLSIRKSWPLLLLSATLGAIIMAFVYFYQSLQHTSHIAASRIAPSHFTTGQPFPVLLQIKGALGKPTAIIIKEELPSGATFLAGIPKTTGNTSDKSVIKWLDKVSSDTTYAYIVSIRAEQGKTLRLRGTCSTRGLKRQAIGGAGEITSSQFHWADYNKDNSIDDREILLVYDLYSELNNLDLDLDQIEEIWLGSGYRWDRDEKSFLILP